MRNVEFTNEMPVCSYSGRRYPLYSQDTLTLPLVGYPTGWPASEGRPVIKAGAKFYSACQPSDTSVNDMTGQVTLVPARRC